MKKRLVSLASGVLAATLCIAPGISTHAARMQARHPAFPPLHVLLISVDGLHAVDAARYIRLHPDSTLARLSSTGITYNQASSARPSDSFPGLLAMVTGGLPKTTGVYYDDSYDRTLYAPGSNCQGAPGTEVVYDESIDRNGDTATRPSDIDPSALPLASTAVGCVPVYPHSFLRVNTIFEVIKQVTGRRTAWADKHPAYDIVNGPSGRGVDDLYTPEIAGNSVDYTTSEALVQQNDQLKVRAVLNEIDGLPSTGGSPVGTPAVFGMNFQAVSVGQKLQHDASNAGPDGYIDSEATPSPELAAALDFVDNQLGRMVDELRAQHLLRSTLIIVTAKHGQSPIDPNLLVKIPPSTLNTVVNSVPGFSAQHPLIAQNTTDDISLMWLTDQSKTRAAVAALDAAQKAALSASPPQFGLGIQKILSGDELRLRFGDPAVDPRTPDIIVVPTSGVIYTRSQKKIAEHGGFNNDDTNVALIISNPALLRTEVEQPVQTVQIAPSILSYLAINPSYLDAVRKDRTQVLPGFFRGDWGTLLLSSNS